MPTTHIFAIGGTGARILKSLTFLLAAGVHTNDRTIRPYFLDPDEQNGDGERTDRSLDLYTKIREATQGTSSFFRARLENGNRVGLGVKGGSNYFGTSIGLDTLPTEMQDFSELMFGKKLLNKTVEKGYLGNPNIGTIAMNLVKTQPWFLEFADHFTKDDDIILVGSIFGGTGAAGIPLLVKTLHDAAENQLPKEDLLSNARIGAVVVQPYFGVESDGGSMIDQGTFVIKTKAALAHYARDIDQKIDVNYAIGDPEMKPYPNSEGGGSQRNPAHLVEVLGAMCIIDFVNGNAEPFNTIGPKEMRSEMNFKHLGSNFRAQLFKPLTQFSYSVKYWQERMADALSNGKMAWRQNLRTDGSAMDNQYAATNPFFSEHLREFGQAYTEWLRELDSQYRRFTPFNLNATGDNLHQFITEYEQRKLGRIFKSDKWSYEEFDEALNKVEPQLSQGQTEPRFLQLFGLATDKLYQDRIVNQ